MALRTKGRDVSPKRQPDEQGRRRQTPVATRQAEFELEWASQVTDEEWELYRIAIQALREAGVDFMLGGGFAQASFTGRWRNTKDIDFYVLPGQLETAKAALIKAGFVDYYDTLAYDRRWIYRSTKGGVIVDIIWAMANQRAQVDTLWLERATPLIIRGEQLSVMAIEEFMWCKLYIIQRDRCDWIDVLNLVYSNGPRIDWDHLIWRLGPDVSLLQALLTLYGWLHPQRARLLPETLRATLNVPAPDTEDEECWKERARFLDSRVWFTAFRPRGERLEI